MGVDLLMYLGYIIVDVINDYEDDLNKIYYGKEVCFFYFRFFKNKFIRLWFLILIGIE